MKSNRSSLCFWWVLLSWMMVAFSSFWKYFRQKWVTISSQVLIEPGAKMVYHVYVMSARDLENSRRQRSRSPAYLPSTSRKQFMCSFGLPLRPLKSMKDGVLYLGGYGFSYSSGGERGWGKYLASSRVIPWVCCSKIVSTSSQVRGPSEACFEGLGAPAVEAFYEVTSLASSIASSGSKCF